MATKWEAICIMFVVLVIGSCTAYEHHGVTELKMAQLECQESNDN